MGFVAGWLVATSRELSVPARPSRPREEFAGVAVTILSERLRNPPLILAQLSTVTSQLPASWRGVDAYAHNLDVATRRLGRAHRVALVELAPRLRALPQRSLLLSIEFWARVRERRVLFFETGTTVACSGAPLSLDAFADYDWVGAAWKWAKPGSPFTFGGNGAFSLRNRDVLLAILRLHEPPEKGNEDMWFVSKLVAAPVLPDVGRRPRLAPPNASARFAVEELFDRGRSDSPLGVYHLMRTLPYHNRSKLLLVCPEAKLLFESNHDPRCALHCPRDRSLLQEPLAVWKRRCQHQAPVSVDRGCDPVASRRT